MPELDIKYDGGKDILTIEGIAYSGEYFRTLSRPNPDRLYRIEVKETKIGKILNIIEIVDPRSKKYQAAIDRAGKKELGDGKD